MKYYCGFQEIFFQEGKKFKNSLGDDYAAPDGQEDEVRYPNYFSG